MGKTIAEYEADGERMRREVRTRRALHTLRETIRVYPRTIEFQNIFDTPDVYLEMTSESVDVIAPLIEAFDILEQIIWASDGCVGHRDCVHSMEPWQRARVLLKSMNPE
jgi:hypothetical protein